MRKEYASVVRAGRSVLAGQVIKVRCRRIAHRLTGHVMPRADDDRTQPNTGGVMV